MKFATIKTHFKCFLNDILSSKTWIKISILSLFSFFIIPTCLFAFSFTKLNVSNSLNSVVKKYQKENACLPNCLLYYHQVGTHRVNTVFNEVEKIREMRDLYPENSFFGVYKSKWMNQFSPGVVDYADSNNNHISFLLMPKDGIASTKWLYDVPTIITSSGAGIDSYSSTTDIYINEQYAQKLLLDKGLSPDDYSSLMNSKTEIKYCWNWKKSNDEKNATYVNIVYTIKGVLDTNSDFYIKNKNLFGDFFVTNEYLTLPFVNEVYFSIGNSFNSNQVFSSLLKVFKYQSTTDYYSNIVSSPSFQTRIGFFDSVDGEYSTTRINYQPHKYSVITESIFDKFLNNENYLYFSILIIANILSTGLYSFSAIKSIIFVKRRNKYKKTYLMLIEFSCSLFLFIGLLFSLLVSPNISVMKNLAVNSYIGVIVSIIECLGVLLIPFILLVSKKLIFKKDLVKREDK